MVEVTIPLSLSILCTGVTGCFYEVLPLLKQHCLDNNLPQSELDAFGRFMMDELLVGYLVPGAGSAIWLLYKQFCSQNIAEFFTLKDNKDRARQWIITNYPTSG